VEDYKILIPFFYIILIIFYEMNYFYFIKDAILVLIFVPNIFILIAHHQFNIAFSQLFFLLVSIFISFLYFKNKKNGSAKKDFRKFFLNFISISSLFFVPVVMSLLLLDYFKSGKILSIKSELGQEYENLELLLLACIGSISVANLLINTLYRKFSVDK